MALDRCVMAQDSRTCGIVNPLFEFMFQQQNQTNRTACKNAVKVN